MHRLEEKDIAYETSGFWVLRIPSGKLKDTFEVYRKTITHSERYAIIGYKGEKGLNMAIAECNRRENAKE